MPTKLKTYTDSDLPEGLINAIARIEEWLSRKDIRVKNWQVLPRTYVVQNAFQYFVDLEIEYEELKEVTINPSKLIVIPRSEIPGGVRGARVELSKWLDRDDIEVINWQVVTRTVPVNESTGLVYDYRVTLLIEYVDLIPANTPSDEVPSNN